MSKADAKISLLLPTRGRPTWVERLFNSISKTVSRAETIEVIVYMDEDDTASHNLTSNDFNITTIIGPGKTMGGYNSACLDKARGDIIILANDDMVMRTPNWDTKIIQMDAQYVDKIYLAYGNDLLKCRSFDLI